MREVESVLTMLEGLPLRSCSARACRRRRRRSSRCSTAASPLLYWALRNWLKNDATEWGSSVDFVDTTDLDAVAGAVKKGETKLVWIETPANPLWSVTDIAAVAEIAHAAGARLAVDSTMPTPILTSPWRSAPTSSCIRRRNSSTAIPTWWPARSPAREDEFWARKRVVRAMLGQILGPFEASFCCCAASGRSISECGGGDEMPRR